MSESSVKGVGPGRPPGTKNKPNFIFVPLSELNRVFKETAQIKVSIEYSPFFDGVDGEVETKNSIVVKPEIPVDLSQY